jgi:hypothetical protein
MFAFFCLLLFVVLLVSFFRLCGSAKRTAREARRTARAIEAQTQVLYDALSPEAKARADAERAKQSFFYIALPKPRPIAPPRSFGDNWSRLKAKTDW